MISILHQESDWLVVDKPHGLSVHNEEDATNLIKTLGSQLKAARLFPVHRLDKETSGLQILALSEEKASALAREFQDRQVRKFYQGVVAGQMPESGKWLMPLSDKAEGWKNPAGMSRDQKPCETHFRKLKESAYFSWLQFEILTGRQHQIRKHCVLSGHALIGDPRYGNPKYNAKIAKIYGFERMALHCSEMQLSSGVKLQSASPPEFEKLFPN